MSSDGIAIEVSDLSKCYHIYDRPQDRLKQSIVPRLRSALGLRPVNYARDFWALRDVSFAIGRGETVGVVGRNGSGKSTILQVICGLLSPTAGRVEVNGRVAALLELGAGFNPEFTGRENVYLNAAMLGLDRAQIDARFDAIAAFADIGTFVDQPVKTYSSGMYVRLAFAVIAHVDAEILIIDEALAVGDAVFTQRCMRFLRRFQESGTLLFVSHDMGSVLSLCRRAIWLDQGRLRLIGDADTVAKHYLQYTLQAVYGPDVTLESRAGAVDAASPPAIAAERGEAGATAASAAATPAAASASASAPGSARRIVAAADDDDTTAVVDQRLASTGWKTGAAEVEAVDLHAADGSPIRILQGGEAVELVVRAAIFRDLDRPIIGFLVKDRLGQVLFGQNTFDPAAPASPARAGEGLQARFAFHVPLLGNGDYALAVSIADGTPANHVQHAWLHEALILKVSSSRLRYGLVGIPFDAVELTRLKQAEGEAT